MEQQIENIEKLENEEKVPKKKPYQTWWFWIIIAVCLVFFVSTLSEDDVNEGNETKQSTTTVEIEKTKPTQINEESYKTSCQAYTYNELARNPDSYLNKKVVFVGEVIQVMEDGNNIVLRVNVTRNEYGYYDDTVYVTYTRKANEGRILEDDIITLYGDFKGLKTYTTVMNTTLTIPSINAKYIEIH